MSHFSGELKTFRWCHEMRNHIATSGIQYEQSGIAMVVSLILLLVITIMGLGMAYVANIQSDMVSAVVNKPISIDAGETCFDNAIEWLTTADGKAWVNGGSTTFSMPSLKLLDDTKGSFIRELPFSKRLDQASYESCELTKLSSNNIGDLGNEIGTSSAYTYNSFVYTIKITAVGVYNSGLSTWSANSSKSVIEAVIDFVP